MLQQNVEMDVVVDYHTEIYEGGGPKGYAYPFALRLLEELQVIIPKRIRRYGGASAGACAALFRACGATPEKMIELMNIDFSQFLDDDWGYFRDLRRLQTAYGWYRGDRLHEWLQDCICQLTGSPNTTFKELVEHTGKELWVQTYNYNTGQGFIFNPGKTPDAIISRAVLASMSLPGVFVPVGYGEDLLWDGGWHSNLPDLPGDGGEIGLRLVSASDVGRKEINGPGDIIGSLIDSHMAQQEKLHISKSLWENIININTGDIGVMDFNLSQEQKGFLANEAENAVRTFVERRGFI